MTNQKQIPLGQAIPDSPHAVSASLPTMADVIGYEEKDPETLRHLKSGYPRFVVHDFLRRIQAHWQSLFERPDYSFWLTSSLSMAMRLQGHLAPAASKLIRHRGVCAVRIPSQAELDLKARLFLQRVGGFLSSRQAEDYLLDEGLLESRYHEDCSKGLAEAEATSLIASALNVEQDALVLSNSGMNAFYAAFEGVKAIQAQRNRHDWIMIGWLYSDSMKVLKELSGVEASKVSMLDVSDLDTLERLLDQRGDSFAGIVSEVPTNPLIQTVDLQRLCKLARKHGIFLIADPTVASPLCVDISAHADILVNSLTKYAASRGDVILGAAAPTPSCPDREALLERIRQGVEPPYHRDLARLSYQLGEYRELIESACKNAARVAAFLGSHPRIRRVFWTHQPEFRESYLRLARSERAVGPLISFEVEGPLQAFYDRVPIAKGPSFGMRRTLLCPYPHLAHYDLVSDESGRKQLLNAGIHPDLVRLSVGSEPCEQIIDALKIGLQ